MLDFFYILTKGGLVLWCIPSLATEFTTIVNHAIDKAVLQGQGNLQKWLTPSSSHQIHYKLDNEYHLVFILGYQKTLNISYADKFLDEIQKRFRDQYKEDLTRGGFSRSFLFRATYEDVLFEVEHSEEDVKKTNRRPRSYEESDKKQKTIKIVTKEGNVATDENKKPKVNAPSNKQSKIAVSKSKASKSKENQMTTPPNASKIDYSKDADAEKVETKRVTTNAPVTTRPEQGDLEVMVVEASSITSGLVDGFWSKLKKVNIFASKTLTAEDLRTGFDTMREHLVSKNVASDVAEKICESVSSKLTGKTLGSFESLTTNIRQAMRDTLVMILTPQRRIDILRDVVDAQKACRPYTITFCGVNGVGKSTNLAKVAYWLTGNDLRVLIAGCDTFRAGAIEQLKTHVARLNNIFNEKELPMIELYERGYGKDAAGIAAQAINYAKLNKFDVVLIDTAGRMQNDEPLMTALAKLIHVNNPDLVLFVGEALVGNEAVDQIIKFNQALIDHAHLQSNPHVIDGIVLTKFDTIDDKVGAAISMTYTTDKPIVFVGIGQQYQDLKTINADVVTEALLK
ncbi:unnamed protein product [Adineta steineri]|uniref:SRP54-type proteins GTP-binding domain-containing protein n=1 Tax=Adineta steineri TaxID=433720 RepID=A0A814WAB8_9BILA|nr:unnamed protein product [Adineta steineri]